MNLPVYLGRTAQSEQPKPTVEVGSIFRFKPDTNEPGYTHGIVLGISDDTVVMFPGHSRSEILGTEGVIAVWYLTPEDLAALEPTFDGAIATPMRIVSVEGQVRKLTYDPENPGSYLYLEKPIQDAPPSAIQLDESKIPEFLRQQNQTFDPDVKPDFIPVMQQLRSNLAKLPEMSQALAIHVNQLESLRQTVGDFYTAINASVDWKIREIPEAEFEHRDPSGKIKEPVRRDRNSMLVVKALADKVRSGLETTGLLVARYHDVVYQLKIENDLVQHFTVHKELPQLVKFRDYLMTWAEFQQDYFRRVEQEHRIVLNADKACKRAWQRYREKHSIWAKRYLIRYGQAHQESADDFDPVAWMRSVKQDHDEYMMNVEMMAEAVEVLSGHLDVLVEARQKIQQQGAYPEDPAELAVAASRIGRQVIYFDCFGQDGELKDATALCWRVSTCVGEDSDGGVMVVDDGKTVRVSRAALVEGQRTPKKKPQLQPARPKQKRTDVPPGKVPVDVPPQQVGDEPVPQPQTVEIDGEPVKTIQPTQLVAQPLPPKQIPAPAPIPAPADVEPVEPDQIPPEVWRDMSQSERIRLAASYNRLAAITYTKKTPPEEGVTKTYIVEIYSYRVKRPQWSGGSPVWYLFAYDVQDGHIKAFILRRIQDVEILDMTFSPRWAVEFEPNPNWATMFKRVKQPKQKQPEQVKFVTDFPME